MQMFFGESPILRLSRKCSPAKLSRYTVYWVSKGCNIKPTLTLALIPIPILNHAFSTAKWDSWFNPPYIYECHHSVNSWCVWAFGTCQVEEWSTLLGQTRLLEEEGSDQQECQKDKYTSIVTVLNIVTIWHKPHTTLCHMSHTVKYRLLPPSVTHCHTTNVGTYIRTPRGSVYTYCRASSCASLVFRCTSKGR